MPLHHLTGRDPARRQTGRQLLRDGVRARYPFGVLASWRLGALLEPRASARAGPAFLFMDFMPFMVEVLSCSVLCEFAFPREAIAGWSFTEIMGFMVDGSAPRYFVRPGGQWKEALRKARRTDRIGGMNVYVATRNPIKLQAVRDAFEEWYPDESIAVVAVQPSVPWPEQPLGEDVSRGAIIRARQALASDAADWGVGIEAGLLGLPGSSAWLSVQVCAIATQGGRTAVGMGPGYELPEDLLEVVLSGTTLREALRLRRGVDDAEHRGAIHYFSGGRINRYDITVQAIHMAVLRLRRRPEVIALEPTKLALASDLDDDPAC